MTTAARIVRRTVRPPPATSPPRKSGRLAQVKSSATLPMPRATDGPLECRRNAPGWTPAWFDEHPRKDEGEDDLHDRDHRHQDEHQPLGCHDRPGDRDRQQELEQLLVGDDAGERLRELVVDQIGDRERQVQEVAERPDAALDERHPPARRPLDERVQAAVRGDLAPSTATRSEAARRRGPRRPGPRAPSTRSPGRRRRRAGTAPPVRAGRRPSSRRSRRRARSGGCRRAHSPACRPAEEGRRAQEVSSSCLRCSSSRRPTTRSLHRSPSRRRSPRSRRRSCRAPCGPAPSRRSRTCRSAG